MTTHRRVAFSGFVLESFHPRVQVECQTYRFKQCCWGLCVASAGRQEAGAAQVSWEPVDK